MTSTRPDPNPASDADRAAGATAAPTGTTAGDVTQRTDAPVQVQRTRHATTRELVAIVVLGVVFGFVYYALDQSWNAVTVALGPLGDLAQNVLIGGWIVVAPLAAYVTRRPGAAIVAEVVAALMEVVFLGNPVGPILFLSALVQGAGAELPLALTRYRRWNLPTFLLSGLCAAVFSFVYCIIRFGWWGQSMFWARLVLHLCSGVVLCGLVAWLLARALRATGVLNDLPAGRDAAR